MRNEILWILTQMCSESEDVVEKIFIDGNILLKKNSMILPLIDQAFSSGDEATKELTLQLTANAIGDSKTVYKIIFQHTCLIEILYELSLKQYDDNSMLQAIAWNVYVISEHNFASDTDKIKLVHIAKQGVQLQDERIQFDSLHALKFLLETSDE